MPMRTAHDLLEGKRRVSFLECDVEGHERRVFWGATEMIGREYPRIPSRS
jgi:hypothetical protein